MTKEFLDKASCVVICILLKGVGCFIFHPKSFVSDTDMIWALLSLIYAKRVERASGNKW